MIKPKKGWLPYSEFKYIYGKVPRLCVDLIIKTNKGIVLSKRDIIPNKGMWHLPGGTVLNFESLEKAIVRIAKGETGLKVRPIKLLGTIEFLDKNAHGHAVSVAYEVLPVSGKLTGSDQAKEIKYFTQIPKNTITEHAGFLKEQYTNTLNKNPQIKS